MNKRGRYPRICAFVSFTCRFLPHFVIRSVYYLFRNTGGYLGLGIRYACIKNLAKCCGENVAIYPNCFLLNINNLSIGNNVSIHPFCYIEAYGGVTIGDNVSIANHTSIISTSHTWNEVSSPICYNPIIKTSIVIYDDVWIACGVRIIGPCIIHYRSIIAAGAVVKGEIQGNCIVGGVPAKIIRQI